MGKTLNIHPATTLDYRRLAEARLPRFLFDYIDGGANDERTLASNVDDFSRILIKQHVLTNVDHLDTSTTIAGAPADMPVVLAAGRHGGTVRTSGRSPGGARRQCEKHAFYPVNRGHLSARGNQGCFRAAFLVPALHDS